MSKVAGVLAAIALAVPAALSAQGFEGVITQEVKQAPPPAVAAMAGADTADPGRILDAVLARLDTADSTAVAAHDLIIHVKGSRLRTDGAVAAQGVPDAYTILDAGSSTLYTVVPSQKTVLVATVDEITSLQKRMQEQMGMTQSATPPTRAELGTKTLNGVRATGYRLWGPDGVAVVWVNPAMQDALAAFEPLQRKMAGPEGGMQAAAISLGFPVLQQLIMKAPAAMGDGWIFSQWTIRSIRKQPQPDQLFALPPDFKQVSLTEMMGGGQ